MGVYREISAVCCGMRSDSLLFSILRKYPEIKTGHLFDLPSAVKDVIVPDDLKNRFFPKILFVSLENAEVTIERSYIGWRFMEAAFWMSRLAFPLALMPTS